MNGHFSRFVSPVILALALILMQSASAQNSGADGLPSPAFLNFETMVGQTSPQQHVTLTNTGESELTITSVSITGEFGLSVNHCAAALPPGAHCDLYVTFTPSAPGTVTGKLTFKGNASNSPVTVSLTGVGQTAARTSTKVTASPSTINAGQSVIFTATVTAPGGGTIPNGEQVAFTSNEQGSLGSGTLSSGVATLTTSALVDASKHVKPGNGGETITASYAGDQNLMASSGTTHVTIDRYVTGITITSQPNPSEYCQPVTFAIQGQSGGGYPLTGAVVVNGEFFFPGSKSLMNDELTLTYSACPPYGAGDVETATYQGDDYNNWGTGSVTQVVNASSTTTTIKSSKNPANQGQAITFSVVVKAPWARVVDGTATLTSGATTLGTITLTDSRGTLTISSLPPGQDTITVTYTPSNDHFQGSSASFVETIN